MLPPQLADVPPAENGLAEAKLERLDDRAPRNDAAVRRRRIELGHHVDVDADAGRPASGRDARLLPVTVHGQRRLQAALLHRNRHRHLSNRFARFETAMINRTVGNGRETEGKFWSVGIEDESNRRNEASDNREIPNIRSWTAKKGEVRSNLL